MRKLRDDISFKEAWEWANKKGMSTAEVYYRLYDIANERTKLDTTYFPDSFYESPPIGAFGRFWNSRNELWGYLGQEFEVGTYAVLNPGTSCRYWPNFEPGLPTDVDKDGYPIGEGE